MKKICFLLVCCSLNLFATPSESALANEVIGYLLEDDRQEALKVVQSHPELRVSTIVQACQQEGQERLLSALAEIFGIPPQDVENFLLVKQPDDVPSTLRNAFRMQQGESSYFMIPANGHQLTKPCTKPGVIFLEDVDEGCLDNSYLFWSQSLVTQGDWAQVEDFVKNGWGVLGLAENLLDTDGMDVICFHPEALEIAHLLFATIHPPEGTIRNEYLIGILLGYHEPNVYAWCFGTEQAKAAFPDLQFTASDTGYSNKTIASLKNEGKHRLDKISASARALLNERSPQDEEFMAPYQPNMILPGELQEAYDPPSPATEAAYLLAEERTVGCCTPLNYWFWRLVVSIVGGSR